MASFCALLMKRALLKGKDGVHCISSVLVSPLRDSGGENCNSRSSEFLLDVARLEASPSVELDDCRSMAAPWQS